MNDKDAYGRLCTTENSIPIFSQPWWLDATAGERHWDVALVERQGRIMASLPYCTERRLGMTLLTQPALTQTLGPWLAGDAATDEGQESLLHDIVEHLPAYHHYAQNWHYSRNACPPPGNGAFRQTTRYTYLLPDLSDARTLWSNLQENVRREIRKAEQRHRLRVRDDLGIDDFLDLQRRTFKRQGLPLPHSVDLVRRLDSTCQAHGARRIFIVEDDEGRRHAGVYLIWDSNSAYYLMGGGDPELRSSGATSLCMWEAIRFAATVTRRFDFEGSMLEPVERFFRAFGAIQQPFQRVTRTPSRLLRTALFIRNFND